MWAGREKYFVLQIEKMESKHPLSRQPTVKRFYFRILDCVDKDITRVMLLTKKVT